MCLVPCFIVDVHLNAIGHQFLFTFLAWVTPKLMCPARKRLEYQTTRTAIPCQCWQRPTDTDQGVPNLPLHSDSFVASLGGLKPPIPHIISCYQKEGLKVYPFFLETLWQGLWQHTCLSDPIPLLVPLVAPSHMSRRGLPDGGRIRLSPSPQAVARYQPGQSPAVMWVSPGSTGVG